MNYKLLNIILEPNPCSQRNLHVQAQHMPIGEHQILYNLKELLFHNWSQKFFLNSAVQSF